jgi:hypothetical protein
MASREVWNAYFIAMAQHSRPAPPHPRFRLGRLILLNDK